jgi:hypothetical protein
MRKASRDLLGLKLRADCKPDDIVRYPDRFVDKRERENGMRHWKWLMTLIEEEEGGRSSDCGYEDAATVAAGNEKNQTLQDPMGETSPAMG